MCVNHDGCPAQTETGLRHWFKTLGNCDGFGPKTIEKLVEGGYTDIKTIYAMTVPDFQTLGFGDKQSENLVSALVESRGELLEDARFLAAFGIANLGPGDSRNLLAHHRLEDLSTLTEEMISSIKGFGEKTSAGISQALTKQWPTISHMLSLGFQLERTPLLSEVASVQKSDRRN